MRISCAVNGCQYTGTHRFPKDETRKTQWIKAIKKHPNDMYKISVHSRICSAHFRKTDFSLTPSYWHNYHTARKILKKAAIPSVFPWNEHIASQEQLSSSTQDQDALEQASSSTQDEDALSFDHTKLKATYSRKQPIAFAEEQPFMETETYDLIEDLIEDPLECMEPESIPDDIKSVDSNDHIVKCEMCGHKNVQKLLPKQQLHDKSVQTIDVKILDVS